MAKIKTATRAVSNAGQRRTLVVVATSKALGELPTESLMEYDGIISMIFDPDIQRIQVQPETFVFDLNGQQVRYTPDVRFYRADARIGFREFKPSWDALERAEQAKLRVAAQLFSEKGFEFSVVEIERLRNTSRLHNIKLLRRYSKWLCAPSFQTRIFELLEARRDLVLADLRAAVGPKELGSLYRMFWDKKVAFDIDAAPLGPLTPVWKGSP